MQGRVRNRALGRPESRGGPGWALALAALTIAGCGAEPGPVRRTIGEPRELSGPGAETEFGVDDAERFRLVRPGPAPTAARSGPTWDTPEGWREEPGSSMRLASFVVAGDPRAECSLVELPGDAGGLAANVDRWRGQMGLGAMESAELDGLPRAPLFDDQAVLVDFEGTYSGMSGDAGGEGFRMIGLLAVGPRQSRFLKMVGPSDVVGAERERFLDLAASFRTGGDAAPGGGAVAGGSERGGGFAWQTPEGWVRGGERQMRAVTFAVGPDTECYVTVLGGDGGGVVANIDRWRRQMGADPLSEAEYDALPRIPMLGAEALYVEIEGSFSGMGADDNPDAMMLGTVCPLGGRSVFVKMIGAREVVADQRDAFLAFCASLEEVR